MRSKPKKIKKGPDKFKPGR